MKHFIINIGCEYGGGPDIGKDGCRITGIPFYDRFSRSGRRKLRELIGIW